MKKILSVLLFWSFLMNMIFVWKPMAEVNEYITYGKDVYSHIEGEGFHDREGLPFNDYRVSIGNNVILHDYDWAAYNMEAYNNGVYEIYVYIASCEKTTFKIITDGTEQLSKTVESTGSYGTFKEYYLGEIYLTDTDKMIISNEGPGSVYLTYFVLKPLNKPLGELYNKEFKATSVSSSVHGEGFYDNTNITPNNDGGIEMSGEAVVLRAEEWLSYDVSSLPKGEYKVYINQSNTGLAELQVLLDDTMKIDVSLVSTEGYDKFENICLGSLYFSEESKNIKIKNSKLAAVMLKTVSLEFISIKKQLEFYEDAEGENKADRFWGKDKVYLKGTVDNSFYPSGKLDIISAQYSENNKLLFLDIESITITPYNKSDVNIEIAPKGEASLIKVLIWNSINSNVAVFDELRLYKGENIDFYINAQTGNDGNDGMSKDSALKTINAAKEKVNQLNLYNTGDVYVHLEGEFELDETLVFNSSDSGKNGFNIIWDGENKTSISGGRKISGFSQVDGTPLYKTKIEDADFRQLYVNGNRAKRARSKWLYFAKGVYNSSLINDDNPEGFVLKGEDFPKGFAKPENMEMIWMPSWRNVRMPVETIVKNENGDYIVTFPKTYLDDAFMASAPVQISSAYYFENAPEFLDEPGEWYYSKEKNELFYYPLNGENMEMAEVYAPQTEMLLKVNGTEENKIKNITFKGIEFKYGAWERTSEKGFATVQAEQMFVPEKGAGETELIPSQIEVDYGENINFINNKFSHLGSVALSLDNKTTNSVVEGNVFDDISASAITIGNFKSLPDSVKDDLTNHIKISNNLIRRVAVEYMTPAITAYYVSDTEISHNDIKDCPYTGISLGWGWGTGTKNASDNKVTNNRIENVLYKLKDGGHIYTLGYQNGTVIENNYLIKSDEWKGGVYLDNGTKNITVRNNVFEKCDKWLKITYENITDNTAYNNYSETGFAVSYPDANNIAEAVKKTDGIWPDEAQEICSNSGLTQKYAYLKTEYEKNQNYVNDLLYRQPYIAKSGIVVPAGILIDGGEGVAYHDIASDISGIGITDSYDGTGHKLLMLTKQGEWTKHKVTISEAGTYKVILNAASNDSVSSISMWIDDKSIAYFKSIKNTGSYFDFEDNEIATVTLSEGEHIFKLEQAYSNFVPHSFRFVKSGDEEFARNDGYVDSILNALIG